MTRRASPSRPLAALLAAVLLALAAGPAAAAVADGLGPDCCTGHCPMAPPAEPSGTPTCCAQAPAAAHDTATVPAPPRHAAPLVVCVLRASVEPVTPYAAAPLTDTGPPGSTRRHLALSVLLV